MEPDDLDDSDEPNERDTDEKGGSGASVSDSQTPTTTPTTPATGDRRPLKTRNKRWAHQLAGAIGKSGITPNAISVTGMFAGLAGGFALAGTAGVDSELWNGWAIRLLWLGCALLVQSRLLCNMLDGMVAVETGATSKVGELYNELPDRVSDAATLVGLGYAAGSASWLGWAATSLAIFIAYVRAQGKVAGAEQHFVGPMAKPHRMATVTLLCLLMTFLPGDWQAAAAWGPGDAWGLPAAALVVIIVGGVVTVGRRLGRVVGDLNRANGKPGNHIDP